MPLLPDSWCFATEALSGAAASITVPAPAPNLAHVLTHLYGRLVVNSTGLTAVLLQVFDGAALRFSFELVANAGVGSIDIADFDRDVTILGTPGAAMTIAFNTVTPSGGIEDIIVTGYDL